MNIRDLAKMCGVSRTTVSLALRNHPRISGYLSAKIRETARQIGYQPDPKLSAMLAEVARNTGAQHSAPLAIVSPWPHRREWEHNWILEQFHTGIAKRAAEFGYRIEDFWLSEPGMRDARMEDILQARGIEGVIILNYPDAPARLGLALESFACVVLGRALIEPRILAVDHDHYQGILMAVRELETHGCQRIGLTLFPLRDMLARSADQWVAGFRQYQAGIQADRRVPTLNMPILDEKRLTRWYRRYQPDAIIGLNPDTLTVLEEIGVSVPDPTSVCVLLWRREFSHVAGVDICSEELGRSAIDVLEAQLRLHRRGIPAVGSTLLVDGVWRNGTTLRHKPRRK